MTPYSIDYHARLAVLELRTAGFWTTDILRSFMTELHPKLAQIRALGTKFSVLIDSTDFPVQGREITDAFIGLINAENQVERPPTAVVVGSTLARMQASRVLAAPHVRVFASRDEALVWLAEKKA